MIGSQARPPGAVQASPTRATEDSMRLTLVAAATLAFFVVVALTVVYAPRCPNDASKIRIGTVMKMGGC